MSENIPPPSPTPKGNVNDIIVTLAIAQLRVADYPMTVTIQKVRTAADKWQYHVDMKRDK